MTEWYHMLILLSLILDQYIGNMVKANVIFGMQAYLGESLKKCNVSSKIGTTPIQVGILHNY